MKSWLVVPIVLAGCGGSGGTAAPSTTPGARTYKLADLAVTSWTLGLPLTGDGRIESTLPDAPADWSAVSGRAEFVCDGCTLGDDHTRMRGFGVPFLDQDGVEFGHLTFATMRGVAEFSGGRVKVTATARSPEIEIAATVDGELAPRAAETKLHGCVTFRPTDALRARAPKLYDVATMTGAVARDGVFEIAIGGTLGAIRRSSPCGGTKAAALPLRTGEALAAPGPLDVHGPNPFPWHEAVLGFAFSEDREPGARARLVVATADGEVYSSDPIEFNTAHSGEFGAVVRDGMVIAMFGTHGGSGDPGVIAAWRFRWDAVAKRPVLVDHGQWEGFDFQKIPPWATLD